MPTVTTFSKDKSIISHSPEGTTVRCSQVIISYTIYKSDSWRVLQLSYQWGCCHYGSYLPRDMSSVHPPEGGSHSSRETDSSRQSSSFHTSKDTQTVRIITAVFISNIEMWFWRLLEIWYNQLHLETYQSWLNTMHRFFYQLANLSTSDYYCSGATSKYMCTIMIGYLKSATQTRSYFKVDFHLSQCKPAKSHSKSAWTTNWDK